MVHDTLPPDVELLVRSFAAWLFGLVIGSFANVCIARIPAGRSVVSPRSRCPRCQAAIPAWLNIPILSYVFLLGRCRSCKEPIGVRYPLIEAANAFLYAAVAATTPDAVLAVVQMLLVTTLLILSVIDLDHQILPDVITLPGIALGLLASFLPGRPSPLESVATAAAGYLTFMALARGWEAARGVEALGQGDWKMVAMLGAFLGPERTLLTVFLASISGTLVGLLLIAARGRTFQHKLPLGTFLGLAGIASLLVGDAVVGWYRGLLDA